MASARCSGRRGKSDGSISGGRMHIRSASMTPEARPVPGSEQPEDEAPTFEDPEPRWPAAVAVIAVGGIYTALPSSLSVGPRWLLFAVVCTLLVPTIVSH